MILKTGQKVQRVASLEAPDAEVRKPVPDMRAQGLFYMLLVHD